jgi:hypothetical protein
MNIFTLPTTTQEIEDDWNEIESDYSFFEIVKILKEILLEQGKFGKQYKEYMNVYTNLMHYIRKQSTSQSQNKDIRDKDVHELRSYRIEYPKLHKMIQFMWEEENVFPEYLTIAIVKGWIANKEFEYMTGEDFIQYLEVGLQIDMNEILFLIRLKEKKPSSLSKDERRRLLSIHEMIKKRSMIHKDETVVVACFDSQKKANVSLREVQHSTPEEDAWLLQQIQDHIH